jgi:hypothetical protein
MLNLDYPDILTNFRHHIAPRRSESAAFLIWFLENYYRLDTLDAVDSVCDQSGDKGIDGIYINEANNSIDVFQSRISQRRDRTVGDAPLREFYGTLSQFRSKDSLQHLVTTAGDADVARLIGHLDLINKVGSFDVRGVYVTNVDLDSNGSAFLARTPEITFIGRTRLISSYLSDERAAPVASPMTFDISGFSATEYIADSDTRALIAPVKARELVNLQGIADQSLFDWNVRGTLGNTQVNRDIVASIRDPNVHKLFPLFHNGITIICRSLDDTPDRITIRDYYVVNGCQSLNALYDNQASLTDDLRILTKIVKMNLPSPLAEQVTRYSNNQNGVKARDFKSNNPLQIRLQNEFKALYSGQYAFEIKRGERLPNGMVIPNEVAGLYLMSFDLRQPWGTHRKYQVFEDKYADLFGRPEVSADRIVLCQVLMDSILRAADRINNKLFGRYALTRFAFLYMLWLVMESDATGLQTIQHPDRFVREPSTRKLFGRCIDTIVGDIVIDVNAEVDALGDDFDYRGKLRDEEWVKALGKNVVGNYLKLVSRNRIPSLDSEWHNIPA